MNQKLQKASDVIEGVVTSNHHDDISLLELKMALHERGFGILMFFFILPLAIPVPYPPGLTTLLGVPPFVFSVQMLFGANVPWLPSWIAHKTLKRKTVALIIEKTSPYLKVIETFLRPRLDFLCSSWGERLIGLVSLLCTIYIIIPFPLTNFIPSVGIFFMALGLMSRDGLIVFLGMVIGIAGISIATFALFYGTKAILAFIPWLVSLPQ